MSQYSFIQAAGKARQMTQHHSHDHVKVSFFSALSVKTVVAVRYISGRTPSELHQTILRMMQENEHYACFRSHSGRIVALDRYGVVVQL